MSEPVAFYQSASVFVMDMGIKFTFLRTEVKIVILISVITMALQVYLQNGCNN